MSAYSETVRMSPIGQVARALARLPQSLVMLARRWALREATYRELVTLDDRMLADIGLHRADLPYVAAAAARGERVPANRNTRSLAA